MREVIAARVHHIHTGTRALYTDMHAVVSDTPLWG